MLAFRWNFIKCNCADDKGIVVQALRRKPQRLYYEKWLLKVWTHGAVDALQETNSTLLFKDLFWFTLSSHLLWFSHYTFHQKPVLRKNVGALAPMVYSALTVTAINQHHSYEKILFNSGNLKLFRYIINSPKSCDYIEKWLQCGFMLNQWRCSLSGPVSQSFLSVYWNSLTLSPTGHFANLK